MTNIEVAMNGVMCDPTSAPDIAFIRYGFTNVQSVYPTTQMSVCTLKSAMQVTV